MARGSERIRVRLKCVDTPETVHPTKPVQLYGPEASAYTKKSLTGKWVRIESDPEDQRDRYGRVLAYVFLDNGRLFNLDLLRDGYARTTQYPCRFAREAAEAEGAARAERLGIWSAPLLAAAPAAKAAGPIIANRRSRVYHLPGQRSYAVSERNREYFQTEEEARGAGYRPAIR